VLSVAGALCAAANAYGAGVAITGQSGSGIGNAFAGTAASAQDAHTIFFNPAGDPAAEAPSGRCSERHRSLDAVFGDCHQRGLTTRR